MSEAEWNREQAARLYQMSGWGRDFFAINELGNIQVVTDGTHPIDLKSVCDRMALQGLNPPLLLRFSDVIRRRMEQIHQRFLIARQESSYRGRYFGVYPIKVNQQHRVIKEIVDFGRRFQWGLEVGSKPELHAVLAMLDHVEGPIICNGYKDRAFTELALIGQKMGHQVFLVVEKPNELSLILDVAHYLKVTPLIGLRCRLAAMGNGHWENSGGDRSKFGLSASEMLEAIDQLRQRGKLESLRLLHFHIGSQIPQIRRIREAVLEAARYFVEVRRLGAPVSFLDVGGGLGVCYDGSIAGSPESVDYTLQEYANDIVWTIKRVCDQEGMPHPDIISESGRALVAHHEVLVVDILSVSQRSREARISRPGVGAPAQLRELWETFRDLTQVSPREALHDASAYRDDIIKLFNLGHASLSDRAQADEIYWQLIFRLMRSLDSEQKAQFVPGLATLAADRYYGNFSVFQSLPDAWALHQVFPVMPLHRLNERPVRQGILVDITCDSDGTLNNFPLGDGTSRTLPLHPKIEGEPYYIGVFLTGAYQEILGDLHNLFGDTHTVHVHLDEDGQILEQIHPGETVEEVLNYVEFPHAMLAEGMGRQLQAACESGLLSSREADSFLRFYRGGLKGYTYLDDNVTLQLSGILSTDQGIG